MEVEKLLKKAEELARALDMYAFLTEKDPEAKKMLKELKRLSKLQ